MFWSCSVERTYGNHNPYRETDGDQPPSGILSKRDRHRRTNNYGYQLDMMHMEIARLTPGEKELVDSSQSLSPLGLAVVKREVMSSRYLKPIT